MGDNMDGKPGKNVSFVESDNVPNNRNVSNNRNTKNMTNNNNVNNYDNGNGNDNGNDNNGNFISNTIKKLTSNKTMLIVVFALGAGFVYFYLNKKKSTKKKLKLELPSQEDALIFDSNGNSKKENNIKKEIDFARKAYDTELQALHQQMMGLHNQSQQQQMYIQHLEQQLDMYMNKSKQPQPQPMQQQPMQQQPSKPQNIPRPNSQRNKKEDDNVALQDLSASELEEIKNKLDMLNNKE